MVLRPRGAQRDAWATQHILAALTQGTDGVGLYLLGVVEAHLPTPFSTELGEDLAVHDRVGPALVRHPAENGDVVGEVVRPGAN